jgi:two-component system nitrogen regulation sensor histidine kinase NtrY
LPWLGQPLGIEPLIIVFSHPTMTTTRFKQIRTTLSAEERRRRKRETVLIFLIIGFLSVMTYVQTRMIDFGPEFPISNTIFMFILININLLLLILLLFLVFRNLVKLLYDRRRRVMGARLRSKLVLAFIALSLLPTTILFVFAMNFITTSIEFWFNAPVEQALENSLQVGRSVYAHAETSNRFFIERIIQQLQSRALLEAGRQKELLRYIQIVQKSFNLNAVEVYAANAERVAMAAFEEMDPSLLTPLSADKLPKITGPGGVRSFSEPIPIGELYRTLAPVRGPADTGPIQAYVVVSQLVPAALFEGLASISKGFEAYQQIKLLKQPIQITYTITLSVVASLVLFCAIWFGFYIAKSITIPIMELAEGTRRVAEGDLSFAIGQVADDEIGSLVDSFNRMTRDLRFSREQLEMSAHKLRDQNLEIEERRRYIEIVLKNVSAGVITMDANGFITTMNTSAEKMLNVKAADVLQRSYQKLLTGRYLYMAREAFAPIADGRRDALEMPVRAIIAGRSRSFLAHANSLKDDGGRHMGLVIVFDDLTELEKAQRMAAWREVARRIAHEVKNPLTPITLSAQRLQRKYGQSMADSVFNECTTMIIEQVDLIRNLVNEFAFFARFPAARPQPVDLGPIIEETLTLYRDDHPQIQFAAAIDPALPRLNADRQQLKQAMTNLINNAIAAVGSEGTVWVKAAAESESQQVRLEVSDDGPGISDEDKERLFEPYFSTKKAGMGLGLAIVSSIIADHNGTISVQDNLPRGAKFIVLLPAVAQ